VLTVSGRGDKDIDTYIESLNNAECASGIEQYEHNQLS